MWSGAGPEQCQKPAPGTHISIFIVHSYFINVILQLVAIPSSQGPPLSLFCAYYHSFVVLSLLLNRKSLKTVENLVGTQKNLVRQNPFKIAIQLPHSHHQPDATGRIMALYILAKHSYREKANVLWQLILYTFIHQRCMTQELTCQLQKVMWYFHFDNLLRPRPIMECPVLSCIFTETYVCRPVRGTYCQPFSCSAHHSSPGWLTSW